jgi:NhaP-type Na+/H+ and K+/H+ antiporter
MKATASYSGSERERGPVHFPRKLSASLAALGCLSVSIGCGRAPSFNILGSFFPAWLICMIVGIALAAVVHVLLKRYKLDTEIAWTILVYPCLAAFFAFTLWLVFFS